MKSLNLKSFVAVLVIAASTLISCKKESIPPPATVTGAWEGKYGYGQNSFNYNWSFVINQDGTLQVNSGTQNNPILGTGTWMMNGDILKAVYHYADPNIIFNISGKVDLVNGKINGSWGEGEVVADQGDFYLDKK